MYHLHNFLGLIVVGLTLMTSFQAYAHRGWKPPGESVHAWYALICLILMGFVAITGLVTSCMMSHYKGDKPW